MATKKQIIAERHQTKARTAKILRILAYIVAAILLNGSLIYFLGNCRQVRDDQITSIVLIVDEVGTTEVSNYRHTTTQYWLRSGSDIYWFDKTAIWKSGYKLDETIGVLEQGEQLSISYLKEDAISDPRIIVEANSHRRSYCTLAGYNKSQLESTILHTFIYFVCTCIFSFVMITSEGWFMQWIRQRNIARKKNERALVEAAKAARRAEREALAAQTNKRASTAKHPKK